jgi:hypothetical protein
MGKGQGRKIAVRLLSVNRNLNGKVLPKRTAAMGEVWSDEEGKLPGTRSDPEHAGKFDRTTSGVVDRRYGKRSALSNSWRPEEEKLLGTGPDREIAKLLNRRVGNVIWRRLKLGIPCHYEKRPWAKSELAMLGVKPDEEVVRLTGHPIKAVIGKRHKLRLPKPNPTKNYWTPEENSIRVSNPG